VNGSLKPRARLPFGREWSALELSIIIINWRSREFVRACLRTLEPELAAIRHEIWVLDNASADGCGEMLAREFPEVRFVALPGNLGFARANNAGAHRSSGRRLLFLNPDTEVCPEAIRHLLACLDRQPLPGVVGAHLLNTDGTVQTSAVQAFPTLLNQALDSEWLRHCFPKSGLWGVAPLVSPSQGPQPVDVLSGACMLMERSVFDKVEGFTEDYFMYSEDVDLCYKCANAGFSNYYVPEARIVHHGGGSSSQSGSSVFSTVMMRDARYRYFLQHRGRGYAFAYRLTMMASAMARMILLLPRCFLKALRVGGQEASLRKWKAIAAWAWSLTPPAKPSA
jgi:GT2 family glycosyltransferase